MILQDLQHARGTAEVSFYSMGMIKKIDVFINFYLMKTSIFCGVFLFFDQAASQADV
jgi:hypothetical protein